MEFDGASLLGLLAALGGGLLVGTERERRSGQRSPQLAIGMRTCILAAMAGAVGALLGNGPLIVAGIAVAGFALASYWHSRQFDPGLTTEFALLATYLLGALAINHAQLAAGLFVLLTSILWSKESLHRFSRQILSQQELGDALLLAASALIVLPLLPDRTIDPFAVLNPRKLWLLVVWVMAINAIGYVGLRVLGPRKGLILAGLFGGFVSSTATIASMGQRSKTDPGLARACVAAAMLSNLSTIVQLGLILIVVSPAFLFHFLWPLLAAGTMAILAGGVALMFVRGPQGAAQPYRGRPFVLSHALLFSAIVATALLGSAALNMWIGTGGVYAASAVAGFADVHAAAVAVGQMTAVHAITFERASIALALAFTANCGLKSISAVVAGEAAYYRRVIAGVVAVNATLVAALIACSG